MALRTSREKVRDTLLPGRDFNPTLDLAVLDTPIRLANKIVNRIQASAADYDMDPLEEGADSEAELVETYLAAWAYCVSAQQLASHSGKTSASFRGQSGMGFEMNNYGQAAVKLLEVAGLGLLLTGTDVGTEWLGLPTSEQTDYVERNM